MIRLLISDEQRDAIDKETQIYRNSLPKGKIRARFVLKSASWRIYKGKYLVLGCGGSTEEEAIESYLDSLGNISDEEKEAYL